MKIDKEFQNLIPPLSEDEYTKLEASLKTEGCRDALVIWKEKGILLDGHNRYKICQKHNIKFQTIEMSFADETEAKIWILENQLGRRNLVPYQRGEIALELKALYTAQAKKRQQEHGGTAPGKKSLVPISAQVSPNERKTRTKLAKIAKVGHDTMSKIEVIAKKADEKTKEKLRKGETTINKEYKAIVQKERKAEQVEAVKSAKLPEGKYHVIVADPPWAYDNRSEDSTHRGRNPYPSMSVDDIKKMKVDNLAHDNCILWLWTTNAFMVEAHQIAEHWGFKVKTILTWAKDRMGTGDWLRGQTEHCLMCIKGKPVVTLTNQTTLLQGKLREHSRKPDEFYKLVESLCPGKRLELFSREHRQGWDCVGAEVEKFK
jgi:N6-adenosine-specific RNA methylase IME4